MHEVIQALFSEEMVPTAEAVRALVLELLPNTKEKVRTGWGVLGFDAPKYFAFLAPYRGKVRLGFQRGPWLEDPERLLEGDGSYVRWVVFSSPKDVRRKGISSLILQAAKLREECAQRHSRSK